MDLVLHTQILQWILSKTRRDCNGDCVRHSEIAGDIVLDTQRLQWRLC